jgi:CRISPR-associated endonuclease Csn1
MADHSVTGRVFKDTNYHFLGITDDRKKLARLYGGGREILKGNVVIGKEGNAHIVEGMAFVRLWLDPTGKKGKGRWYAEPVYYADIPFLSRGGYVSRFAVSAVARIAWQPVPDTAMEKEPIVIRRNDVLEVNGNLGRFAGMDINTCSFAFTPLVNGLPISIPTLGKWDKNTRVRVVQEDCLGHCYDDLGAKGHLDDQG